MKEPRSFNRKYLVPQMNICPGNKSAPNGTWKNWSMGGGLDHEACAAKFVFSKALEGHARDQTDRAKTQESFLRTKKNISQDTFLLTEKSPGIFSNGTWGLTWKSEPVR